MENDKFWRMVKIGHNAKAIGFAKWSAWLKNSNCQKHAKNVSRDTLELFCAKKRRQKKPNIREMTSFGEWSKLATMQRPKALQNGQFGSKIQFVKNMPETSLKTR